MVLLPSRRQSLGRAIQTLAVAWGVLCGGLAQLAPCAAAATGGGAPAVAPLSRTHVDVLFVCAVPWCMREVVTGTVLHWRRLVRVRWLVVEN